MLLHLTLAAHTHTHTCRQALGVCLALRMPSVPACLVCSELCPPLPGKTIPPLAICGSTCPHLAYHYVYLYICGIIFPFVCARMICLFVVCLPVCVGVISVCCLCVVRQVLEYGADFS